jgi:hypothetical protein
MTVDKAAQARCRYRNQIKSTELIHGINAMRTERDLAQQQQPCTAVRDAPSAVPQRATTSRSAARRAR